MPRPYYEHDGITIYHGDCRDILPSLTADALVTDPPYLDLLDGWTQGQQALALIGFFVVLFVVLKILLTELRLILLWLVRGAPWRTSSAGTEVAQVREAVEAMHATIADAFGPSEQKPPPLHNPSGRQRHKPSRHRD